MSSSYDRDLLEAERKDVILAESIIRSRTRFYSTLACLPDETLAGSSPDSPMKSGHGCHLSSVISNKNPHLPVVILRWSNSADALPALPKDTQVNLRPFEGRSIASTMSVGFSDRSADASAKLDEEDVIHVPEPETALNVTFPIPSDTEQLDAFAMSIVKRNAKAPSPTAKSRNTILFVCIIAAIVIAFSAVVAAVCGSGRCSRGSSLREDNDDLPKQPPPSLAKIDDRKLALFSFINNFTFGESLSPYNNGTTPEEQAMNWLVDSDPLQLWPQNNSFRIRQRYALLTFWFNSNNTDEWINSTGWLDYDDECTWFGISCLDIDHGPYTGVQRTVTEMDLGYNGISGIIPSDLGLLSNLQYFGLESNQLYGSLPSSIGEWTDLEHLQLQLQFTGQLTGQIPETIGNLHHLVYADFSYNALTGELPSSIGNWKDIVYVDFSGLPINSTIPFSVGNWKNVELVSFMMVSGNMHGTLPESIGNWVNLRSFFLIGNDFSGVLPSTISNWTNLHVIDLSFNEFSGALPQGVLNWTSIEQMYVYETNLTGGVPEVMCTFSNLTVLEADCASRNFTCNCCSLCI
jgi:Leucine-rich repeat (LRR) protein